MTTSVEEIIAQSTKAFGGQVVGRDNQKLLDALEAFYMNGSSDESGGNADSYVGHFYRVDRWIVITDSQGFHNVHTYGSETDAKVAFKSLEDQYAKWEEDDED